jgi:hypothetical protein
VAPRVSGLLVELFGLPAAGKSTLARRVLALLAERGVPADLPTARVAPEVPTGPRLVRKLGLVAEAVAARPAARLADARRVARAAGADRAGRIVQWLVTAGIARRARPAPGVHLLEEGLLQALWSVGMRGDAGSLLEAELDPALLADLVVVVEAPSEVLLGRLAGRPARPSLLDREKPDRLASELARGGALAERLVAWWTAPPRAGALLRVSCRDDADLDPAAAAVADWVGACLQAGPEARP